MFLLSPTIFLWDLAILLMMATGLCLFFTSAVWIHDHRGADASPRRLYSAGLVGFIGLLGTLVVAYGSFIEPQIIVTNEYATPFPATKPLKIAVIADMHVGPYKGAAFLERVVKRVNAELPDVILIAGDFLYDENSDLRLLEPLKDLHASLGVYGVTGNHDAGHFLSVIIRHHQPYTERDRSDELTAYLERIGITVLRNQSRILNLPNGNIAIAGTDDVWSASHSLSGALANIPDEIPLILLAHNPDIILDPQSHRAQLIVAGHTHGGQFRLPFIGPIAPFPDRLGHKFDQGLFQIDGDTTLAITRGVGETLARARLFAWPEIMILQIQKSSPAAI